MNTEEHALDIIAFLFRELRITAAPDHPLVELLHEELYTRIDEAILAGIREYRRGIGLECEECQ